MGINHDLVNNYNDDYEEEEEDHFEQNNKVSQVAPKQ
jgi:hypothetical protein